MSSKKPVVVYGASGYTGRLVCEYLREYGIPFIAAGRSAEKLNAAMKSNVAGIETANYEVVEVAAQRRGADQALQGRVRGAEHGGARSPSSATRSSRPAWPRSATTPTPPASRTG